MRVNLSEDKLFFYRTVGIVEHNAKLLIHKSDNSQHWSFPGGGCDFGEESKIALTREFKEEIGADIKVNNLMFVTENFFSENNKQMHEIGLYYSASFINDSIKFYSIPEFQGIEEHDPLFDNHTLHFKWVNKTELETTDLKPNFLKKELFIKNNSIRHITQRD